jgi:phosphonate transport system substrate-binding protein
MFRAPRRQHLLRDFMAEAMPSADIPQDRRPVKSRGGSLARFILFLCLAAAVIYVGVAGIQLVQENKFLRENQASTVASTGLVAPGSKHLDAKFTDKDSRLLADPPASSDQWLNPEQIVVAHISGTDETPGTSWADWEAKLSQVVGKKVVDQVYTNSVSQTAAAGSGKVTLLALHAADAPFLVNNYGFEPLAALGDQSGINGNRLDLIVPAGSLVAKPEDLREHKLVCTVPSSITGYRAAIAVLMQDKGLRPNVDYEIIWSLSQKESINGIVAKKYEAAAVSDDKLQSMLAKGTIDASQYKIIYQSPVIPRTVIGCFFNLNPTLAGKLRDAILAIDSGGATTSPSDVMKFLPVDYKGDFQFVRNIDDQFDPRFDAQKNVRAE